MKIPFEAVVQLLHGNGSATLATQSLALPGYPFASALSFVPDENQCPIFLISRLAEHTRNLSQDPRVSLGIHAQATEAVETCPRMTLIGDVEACEASHALQQRYLRYHPSAERYLSLGDFGFYRLTPRRIRLIAGFGQMGWIEQEQWHQARVLPLEVESELLGQLDPARQLIGIDCYGVDHIESGARKRICFPRAEAPEQLPDALRAQGLL